MIDFSKNIEPKGVEKEVETVKERILDNNSKKKYFLKSQLSTVTNAKKKKMDEERSL